MNNKIKITKKFIYIGALVFIVLFSVGYSALSQTLGILGNTRYNVKYPVRVTGIALQGTSNNGVEQFSPNYTWNTTTTGVDLPALNSTVTYTVTVRNYSNEDKGMTLEIYSNSNNNNIYETSNMPTNNVIPANSSVTFNIIVKYNSNVSTLPATTTNTMTILYKFGKAGAMFINGMTLNTKMKKLVNPSATSDSQDTTITNITRFNGIPDSSNLIDSNIVSEDGYAFPIYMWYDSTNTTIYWYTEAANIYYNQICTRLFYNLKAINSISNLNDISSEYTTKMDSMFSRTGYNSTTFTLDLGTKFDTSKVTDMHSMFEDTGQKSTAFTLNLGDKFDTSKVTNMSSLFWCTGHDSTVFTLNLGSKFDTSNVITMGGMFYYAGYSSTVFTLDLGSKFDTSNVTSMGYLFSYTGYSNTSFTLDLGSKFDTSNVTNMYNMFYNTGYKSTIFTLDLGDKFDTSNVTDMRGMFYYTGYKSTVFTLNLGSLFDTSKVTSMYQMFTSTGSSSTVFTLDLGSKFDTSNVTSMGKMFSGCGNNSTVFTLNLGLKFDTSKVTSMDEMFYYTGCKNTSFTLNLGSKFDTSNVTTMSRMFWATGQRSTVFSLNLGSKFDTSKVTNMQYMFYYSGNDSPTYTLNLGDKFDTSNVTDMSYMFGAMGKGNTSFTLDLGDKFDTSKATTTSGMFSGSTTLKTIYVPSNFDTSALTSSSNMFNNCTNLVGGQGTVFDSSHIDVAYAHIDCGTDNPGYFTDRNATTLFYWGYDSNNKVLHISANTLSTDYTYSKSGTTDGKFTFAGNAAWYSGVYGNATSISFDSEIRPTTMAFWFYNFTKVTTFNNMSNLNTSSCFSFREVFKNMTTITSIDLSHFDTSLTTDFNSMFENCNKVTVLDISTFDTSNGTHFTDMFSTMSALKTIYVSDLFDTSNKEDDANMFYTDSNLVGGANTAFSSSYLNSAYAKIDSAEAGKGYFTDYRVTKDIYWGYVSGTTTLYLSGTPLPTDMTYAASGTTNGIFKNNTSTPWNSYKSAMTEVVVLSSFKPSSLGYWFNGFTKINSISGLDLIDYTYCKSFIGLFYGNTTITSLDLSGVNTTNVVTMYQMFRGCTALTEIDLNSFNTANVLNYGEMFYGDTALVSIYVSGNFTINNSITSDTNMFYNCTRVVGGAGTTYSSSAVTSARAHIDGGTSNPGYFTRKSGLRITGRLDGLDTNDLGIYATCDVTINNVLVADDVTSYFERLEPGTIYNIVCTPANGITAAGVVSGSMSGTIGEDLVNTRLSYSTTGYTRLEYIESIAGAKYKDTNNALFSGWNGARFEYDIMSTGGGYLLYRQRTSYNDYLRINGTTVSFSYDDAGASISNGITTNQRQIVTFQIYGSGSNYTYKLTANGKSVTSADGPLSFQYRIFFGNTSTSSFIGRIYGFKYYLNTNDLVYSFVPMQRISDGKVGLYDIITGTFISSNGTAEFTAGPVSTN